MHKKKILNSPRLLELKRKRRRVMMEKILLIVFILGAVIFLLTYISRINKFNITRVEVSGNKVVDAEEIKNKVMEDIKGKYLGLFPKTNFILYPKNFIKESLATNFRRLKDISINVKNLNTLEVGVAERTGLYTWCGEAVPEVSTADEKCYFMDETGYIFDEAPYFSGGVYLKFYGTFPNYNDSPLGFYFANDIFNNLVTFKANIEGMGLKPEAMFLGKDGDVEVRLAPGSGARPKILIKSDGDFEKAAENLQAALSTEPLLTDFKKKYSSLQYIDLRYGNKVYYKFSSGASVLPATEQ
jgi:cell division septal protein FtsQ